MPTQLLPLRRDWWVLALIAVPATMLIFDARSKPHLSPHDIRAREVVCRPVAYKLDDPIVATIGCDNGLKVPTTDGALIGKFLKRGAFYKGDTRMYCTISKSGEIATCH